MGNIVRNEMRVYGNKKELIKFKADVYGNGDSYFSFNKIKPEPKDTSAFAKERLSNWHDWHFKNWGSDGNACEVKLSDEGDHLIYKFYTINNAPFEIYFTIIETYTGLSFNMDVWEPQNDWGYELESEYGQYTKFIEEYIEFVPWRNDQYKILHYRKDLLKNTLQVFKEEIFDEPKTKDLPAATDDSDSKDLPVATDDLEDDLEDLIDADNRKY